MIKYILNSGGIGNSKDKGAKFFAEIVNRLGDNPKVLFCFFAQKREDWEDKFTEYSEGFKKLMPKGVSPSFELAQPDTFAEQIAKHDAIYIHGGDDHLLQYWLRQFDLPKLWEGKTVATNSAGSDAIAKSFWAADWRKCMDGLGLLPIKFIPHYGSKYGADSPLGPIDWKAAKKELEEYGDDWPTYALKEGEYTTIESSGETIEVRPR